MDSSTSEDERLSSISSGKKVRFDLNDEVFEIPNKWDRLSGTRAATRRNKLVNEVCKNQKLRFMESENRSRPKQTKNKKVKKTVKTDNKSRGTSRPLASPSNHVLSLDSSVLSTEIPQKRGGFDKALTVDKKTKKISPTGVVPEVKLKLSHRGSTEIPQTDIVLPKITYNSDLKKAIENAVVRNRISAQESLAPSKERSYDGKRGFFTNTPKRSLSMEEINYSTRKTDRLLTLPEQEPKFSELSRDVESWIPFTNGTKETKQRNPKRESSIQPAWMIPNSILY